MSNHTQRKIFTYHCFALIFSLLFSQSGRLKLKQSLWQSLWAVLFLIYSLSGWLLTKYRVQYPPVSPHWGQIWIQYHSTALNWPKLVKQNHVPVTGILKKVLSYPLKLILESVFFFFLERKKITLTVGNQLSYKKIYNVVGYLKGKRNPGVYIQYALTSCCIAACLNMSVFEKGSDRQKYDGAMHSLSHPTQPSHNLDLVWIRQKLTRWDWR